ncbi:hypothetical protein F4861DRAFT_511239 [Xylaria intraflava]|nr:hypothetical protein F4861DRAFT_511239 [Xylaria intraflava]
MVKSERSPIGHGQLPDEQQGQSHDLPPAVDEEQPYGHLPGADQDPNVSYSEDESSDTLNSSDQPSPSEDHAMDPQQHPSYHLDATSEMDSAPNQPVPGNPDLTVPYPNLFQYTYNDKERDAIRSLLDMPEVEADIPIEEREKESSALMKKLMPHQRVGLTWLIKQEQSPHKGGILADDMGLGKTIQAIALILARPPNDGARKTTLIVVPTSLLHQWEQEIIDKVKPSHRLKTIIFHSQKKRNMTVSKLLSHDIVLTTYGTIAHEWKKVFEKRKSKEAVLLASHAIFHRIILDEAHNIKNRNTLSSKAADRLRGTYRLCMTGTPLMNQFNELYPLVRFLRIEPYREWSSWSSLICDRYGSDTKVNIKRLQVLLSRILLRRTEKTMVDGFPILTLPELSVHTVHAIFEKDQKDYYDALQQHSRVQMNKYLKEGTVTRHYWHILLLILRLRQCCCHPHLIKDHAIPEGVDMTPDDMIKLAHRLSKRAVDRIKVRRDFECPLCNETTQDPIIIYPCGHHVCGNCVTNMVSTAVPEIGVEYDEAGAPIGRCPADGCSESVDSKRVICHKWFAEVHLPSEVGDRDLDDSDEDDEDSDEEGSLKDFIVSDGDEISDDDEDLDDGSRSDNESSLQLSPDSPQPKSEDPDDSMYLGSRFNSQPRLNSPQPKAEDLDDSLPEISLPAAPAEDDLSDSDDSFPPIEELHAKIMKKVEAIRAKSESLAGDSDAKPRGENSTGCRRKLEIRNVKNHNNNPDNGSTYSGIPPRQKKRPAAKGLARPKKKAKKEKSKGRTTELTLGALKKSTLSSAAAKERYFNALRKNWETSAKIEKAMELLGTIRRDYPNEKTLVFSQFTSFLDLMEIPISDDGYNYRRYDGSMSNVNRDAAVNDFVKKPEVKIMLVSLRCGNAGLNLYAATRVILLDPFWNPSVEDQAIKRAHRLGQVYPVVAYRILVEETIEDRILKLQEVKRERVDNALNPEARKDVSRLSTSELAGLFGIKRG